MSVSVNVSSTDSSCPRLQELQLLSPALVSAPSLESFGSLA